MEELLGMLDQVQFCGFFDGPTEQEYDDVVYKGKSDEKPKRVDERKDDIIAKIRVWVLMILTKLQSGVAGCVKGVVTCFLEVTSYPKWECKGFFWGCTKATLNPQICFLPSPIVNQSLVVFVRGKISLQGYSSDQTLHWLD